MVERAALVLLLAVSPVLPALDDPFRPPQSSPSATSRAPLTVPDELRVNMILRGKGRDTAIIAGRALTVGERIQGFEVLAIERDRVRLGREGQTVELTLDGGGGFKSDFRQDGGNER